MSQAESEENEPYEVTGPWSSLLQALLILATILIFSLRCWYFPNYVSKNGMRRRPECENYGHVSRDFFRKIQLKGSVRPDELGVESIRKS